MDTFTKYGPGDEITWGSVTHPSDPRYVDVYDEFDDLMTQGDAEEQVADEWAHNADCVADWLAGACLGQQDVSSRTECDDVMGLPVPRLLSILLNGTDAAALAARRELRERYVSEHLQQIRAEAKVLWEKQWGSADEAPCLWGDE